eukprot:GDKK01054830.1.p1 GENE.GDKK01054830.1~~GDKK01054830.1.p1  ORF type:complete len:426 (-),score=85.20 GDKK01054830.1:173-1450(-)
MSAIPLAAKMKRDQATRRDQTLGGPNPMQQQMMMRQGMPQNAMMMQNNRFAGTNRGASRRADRSGDFLTAQEVEMAMEARKASGSQFRTMFLLFIVLVIGVLSYAKYDVEMGLVEPQLESGKGFGEVKDESEDLPSGSSASAYPDDYVSGAQQDLDEMNQNFKVLGVDSHIKTERQYAAEAGKKDAATLAEEGGAKAKRADPDLIRRLDIHRAKEAARLARDNHNAEYGALVACGKACQENHMQVEAAYQALDSILPRSAYTTMFGKESEKDKTKRWTTHDDLKNTYEETKAKIEEENEGDEEIKGMALAELKDAFEILRSPEARQYYHLYGRKPVEAMKRTSSRHGGWGQELMLGTYKYRLIFSILDYFSNSWAETIVIGSIISLLLARLPSIISQTMKMQAVLEAQEELDEMTNEEGAQERAQ